MSVSLTITWSDSMEAINLPIASQAEADLDWPRLAHELKLQLLIGPLPLFLNTRNFNQVAEELHRVGEAKVARTSGDDRTLVAERYQRLDGAFKKMRDSDGWRAMIG